MTTVTVSFKARAYQQAEIDYFRGGGKHSIAIWHRKAGKDRTATFIESELACKHVGLYWHALPKYEDARKVIWDAITPDGKRLIDVNFPPEIVKKRHEHEMKIELVNGSIWQPVGADNYNSLVGAFPRHVTWSEFALMNPAARNFIRPALAMAGGSELIITTPRGYNHAHELYQYAQTSDQWHHSRLTVDDTGVLPPEVIAEERRSMPDELFRQEYYVDFSAANIGAILGRYMEQAEKEGRIVNFEVENQPVIVSSDIGFRDTSAWWFWQPKLGGFDLVDYDEGSGMDADDWIDRLRKHTIEKSYRIGMIWLPHDARNKTFATKHSALERFVKAWGSQRVNVVPDTKKADRYNAARLVARRCRFHRTHCAQGLPSLREWSFEYNPDTKAYSKEARHDWASHGGDAFSYGALVLSEQVKDIPKADGQPGMAGVTMDTLWEQQKKTRHRRI